MSWTYCPHPKILGEPQSLASMCWFAGYTMLFRWADKPEQEIKPFIKSKIEGAGIDFSGTLTRGLLLKDNLKAARALGLGARSFGSKITGGDLGRVLAFSPIWATGKWFESSHHVLVIVGVSEAEVEYYDPWYDTSPEESFVSHKATLDWILNGDHGKCTGLSEETNNWSIQYVKP